MIEKKCLVTIFSIKYFDYMIDYMIDYIINYIIDYIIRKTIKEMAFSIIYFDDMIKTFL